MTSLTLRHYTHADLAMIRELLLDIHDDCYADHLDDFHSRERFAWFVDHWGSHEGFTCVIGYDGDEAVGYAYGAPATPGREWWRNTDFVPQDNGSRSENNYASTYHLSELMVQPRWRKTGASVQLHEALVAQRPENLAALTVDIEHPKVQAMYEEWGYQKTGEDQPFADSPVYAVMVRRLPD